MNVGSKTCLTYDQWVTIVTHIEGMCGCWYRHAKYVDVTVVKGDILYLPVFWYHDVSGESGRNISINYWYRCVYSTFITYVWCHVFCLWVGMSRPLYAWFHQGWKALLSFLHVVSCAILTNDIWNMFGVFLFRRQHPMKLDYIDAEPPTSPLDSVVAIE